MVYKNSSLIIDSSVTDELLLNNANRFILSEFSAYVNCEGLCKDYSDIISVIILSFQKLQND